MSLSKYSTWSIPIYKLMHWHNNTWEKTHSNEMKEFLMKIHCDHLIIYNDDEIIHSFNINGKLKAIFRNDIFILLNGSHQNKVRKIRFMLKASPRKINNCVKRLSALFPVVKQSASEPSRRSVPACRTDQTLQKTIQKSSQNGLEYERELPSPRTYDEFVKLCLLDKNFTQTVMETEKILKSLLRNS